MKNTLPLVYHPAAFSIEEEFLENLRKKSAREGEEGLMLAILEEAIACFRKYVHARDQRGKALFRDAAEWILERQSEWIFSFENICETLGIDASYLRQGLIQWKEKDWGRGRGLVRSHSSTLDLCPAYAVAFYSTGAGARSNRVCPPRKRQGRAKRGARPPASLRLRKTRGFSFYLE